MVYFFVVLIQFNQVIAGKSPSCTDLIKYSKGLIFTIIPIKFCLGCPLIKKEKTKQKTTKGGKKEEKRRKKKKKENSVNFAPNFSSVTVTA